MICVGDLQRSIDFYTRAPGMRPLRKNDKSGGCFTNAFVEDPDGYQIKFVQRKPA